MPGVGVNMMTVEKRRTPHNQGKRATMRTTAQRKGPRRLGYLLVPLLGVTLPASGTAQQYHNLQVLPDSISSDELDQGMLGNLRGLGLPRLAGEGCCAGLG